MLQGGLTVSQRVRPVSDVAAPARESLDDEKAFERAYESALGERQRELRAHGSFAHP
jgi:hypothetical protein